MSTRPRIIVFASGTATAGGTGFENLVASSRSGILDAEIVAVVSNHEHGGVRDRASQLSIPFVHFAGPYTIETYQQIIRENKAEWVALSGWLKMAHGLDPRTTFNIHPAPLSFDHGRFGGKGLYGNRVHEAVLTAYKAGQIREGGFSMHFVTEEFDRGPIFFEYLFPLRTDMSADDLSNLVHAAEHEWQPKITNMVVQREISWDGMNPSSLKVPAEYQFLPKR